jgi:hypothetical protein
MPKKKKAEKVKSATVEKKRHANPSKPRNEKNGKDAKVHVGNAVQDPPTKIKNPKKRAAQAEPESSRRMDDGQKMNRLTMIKTRHEAMKREIDQIREDLESEEEE